MSTRDLISFGQLVLGGAYGIGMLILLKRNKSRPKAWPQILGIGAGMYMFIASMIGSIILRPVAEFMDYTISNFFWTLILGIVSYVSGNILARRFGNR